MIKAVVFDLDDTLISEKQYVKSGFKVVSNKISNDYNLDWEIVFNKMLELFEGESKEVFNRILDNFNIKCIKEYILELIKSYREHTPEIEFFNDVIPTITDLRNKGYKLGIITDGYKETQIRKIEVLKCRELFDEIIVTDEFGREFWKPHEKPYKLISERLGVNLDEMIYVGDNVTKDFVTANKLGLETFKIARDDRVYSSLDIGEEYLAKYEIRELGSIFDILSN